MHIYICVFSYVNLNRKLIQFTIVVTLYSASALSHYSCGASAADVFSFVISKAMLLRTVRTRHKCRLGVLVAFLSTTICEASLCLYCCLFSCFFITLIPCGSFLHSLMTNLSVLFKPLYKEPCRCGIRLLHITPGPSSAFSHGHWSSVTIDQDS